jgi:DNA-binding SARP family transcriptional activator
MPTSRRFMGATGALANHVADKSHGSLSGPVARHHHSGPQPSVDPTWRGRGLGGPAVGWSAATDCVFERQRVSRHNEIDSRRNESTLLESENRGGRVGGAGAGLSGVGLARVALLGPVEVVTADGGLIHVESGRQSAVMAVLSLRANAPVSAEELLDAVWDPPHPAGATQLLQTYVCRLRRAIQPDSPRWHRHGVLSTVNGSYTLSLPPAALDVTVFEQHVARAAAVRAQGDLPGARDLLDAALGCWRGEPLASLPGPALERERLRLKERWLAAKQERLMLDLRLGQHLAIIADLHALVAQHPLQEQLVALLMLALYRSGRQSDALSVFATTRERLDDQLGVEPGAALQQLYVRILRADDDLLRGVGSPATPIASNVSAIRAAPETKRSGPLRPPAQLPRDVSDFTGRTTESADLAGLLSTADTDTWMPLAVITGRPGVGKTTLAVHVAHQVRDLFADGQVYLNLRGTDPHHVPAAEALDLLLDAVGVAQTMLPESSEKRAGLFRTAVAGRRILIVLDDARNEQQVRTLLPGSPGCAVLITSRTPLAGLDGTRHVRLESLDDRDGLHLLRRIAGDARINADSAAATDIVAACAGLPLAIHLAAGKLIERPGWPLRHLVSLLHDESRTLDTLTIADRAVRHSIAMTANLLTPAQREALTTLSLSHLTQFDIGYAAAALGVDLTRAAQLVDALVVHHMLDITGYGPSGDIHLQFHPLTRIYAREQTTTHPDPSTAIDFRARVHGPNAIPRRPARPEAGCSGDPESSERIART